MWKLLVFLLPALAYAQGGDASQLLTRLQTQYRAAQQYYFQATVETEMAAGGLTNSDQQQVTLARGGTGRFRYETKGEGGWLTVSNGQKSWSYVAKVKQYMEEEVAAADEQPAEEGGGEGREEDEISRATAMLYGDYTRLAQSVLQAAITKQEDLKVDGQKVHCTVVTVQFRPNAEGLALSRDLWIDPTRLVVLKAVTRGRLTMRGLPAAYRSTVTYKTAQVTAPLPDELFTFIPPAKVKQVELLNLPVSTSASLIGKLAPNFELKNLDGEPVSLSSFRGKVVLIDFWASWCPPCRRELPSIARLHERFQNSGLVVLGVNNEGRGTAQGYLKKAQLTVPTVDDSKNKACNDYRIRAWPSVFIIDKQGHVAKVLVGSRSEEDLFAQLKTAGFTPGP